MNSEFRLSQMTDNSILYIYSIKDSIQIDPDYQRMSDIWNLEKRQLLIDSIINGFDLPKIYFHEFMPMKKANRKNYRYAIVDGKQRLQTIWKFINGEFTLADKFEYIADENIKLGGLTYTDLANKYPLLKIKFDGRTLPITVIQTKEIELIEEMFSRLNEAVPLNSAEKRNALGGSLTNIIRDLSKHGFFLKNLPFENRRYRHYDLATKFLLFENKRGFTDTNKQELDRLVISYREKKPAEAKRLHTSSEEILDRMSQVFISKDKLLSAVGMVTIYYLLFKFSSNELWFKNIDRTVFSAFEAERIRNRQIAEDSIEEANYKLLEFDRSTPFQNDKEIIKMRYEILKDFIKKTLSSRK
jgi:hypothetical protein